MKKKIMILAIALCGMVSVANSQIKVANGGNLRIGNHPNIVSPPAISSKLEIFGSATISGDVNIAAFNSTFGLRFASVFYSSGGELGVYITTLAPAFGSLGSLGQENNRFRYLYTDAVYYQQLFQISDRTMKQNIALVDMKKENKLNQVKVYKYDLSEKLYDSVPDERIRKELIEEGKNQTGVMAQELKEIYPELVKQNPTSKLYSVNYVGLIPYMLLAIQEQSKTAEKQNELIQIQSKEIESLKSQLTFMQLNCCNSFIIDPKPIKDITKSSSQTTTQTQVENLATARLDQNVPNPFTENTKISFFVPNKAQTAQICVYDLTGKQLKQLGIAERGETSVSIQGQELQAGIYLYALLVDGQLVDSKRMVLTK